MDKQAQLQNELKALAEKFAQHLPGRLQEIDTSLSQWLAAPAMAEPVVVLHRLLHSIAGTAGTFGQVELGARARALENRLAPVLAEPPASLGGMQAILPELREFRRWAAQAPLQSDAPLLPQLTLPMLQSNAAADPQAGMLVYLVGGDPVAARDMAGQLHYFGFDVNVMVAGAELMAGVKKRMPTAVIFELASGDEIHEAAIEISQMRKLAGRPVPAVIVCRTASFDARLAAVRAGADAFFQAPLEVITLSHRLDALISRAVPTPYRILNVDDDEVSAGYYATVLRGAGMDVRTLSVPEDILRVMGEYRPELVLMDVYMPGYSGIELTQMIRQDNVYLDVPIVFLSSENDAVKQLAAIQSGADDFLVKPIEPAHLVSAITHRAKRYRALRGLIMRDSLTGLFNHSAIKEHLIREVSRARRAGTPLSMAVLDLDLFKRVNDNYGHMIGDQVLRALSRLLQQWMRRSDIIGRYGGEEFVVILPGTTAAGAVAVLNNVREAFSKVRHHAEEREFKITFSVGVADLDSAADADSLFKAADEALYRAKNGGRNRVEQA